MINTDDIIARFKVILDYYNLSPSLFADKIGVQRSGLSHLLSGRNKPSLDFVLKIIEHFPEVDPYWLLNGKGTFPQQAEEASEEKPAPPPPAPAAKSEPQPIDLFSAAAETTPVPAKATEANEAVKPIDNDGGEIDRIVIFYKDGTFKSYRTGK